MFGQQICAQRGAGQAAVLSRGFHAHDIYVRTYDQELRTRTEQLEHTMSTPLSGSQLPVYTWDDISKHKSAESLWVVIEGKVYDITSFQEEVKFFFWESKFPYLVLGFEGMLQYEYSQFKILALIYT